MNIITQFIQNGTWGPFKDFIVLMSLPPERTREWIIILGAFMIMCELTRLALATVFTRSVLAHVTRCLLTFAIQAVVLAAVLVWADHCHPGRGWINLGYALLFYFIWYLTGQFVLLARQDTEGADLGFMTVGALITFSVGIVAAVVW
jgi:hypothetical protein